MAQPFDAAKLRLSGGPFPVAEQVGYIQNLPLASFSVSNNGVLVLGSAGGLQEGHLTWFDRAGKRLGTVGEPGRYSGPVLSPDEKQIAVEMGSANEDIWLIDLARGISTRFTFDPKRDIGPVWSPDGGRIAFSSFRDGNPGLYQKIASGAGKDELLLKSGTGVLKYPSGWSPDGRLLLYTEMNPKTMWDLVVLTVSGDKKPVPFLQTEFNERDGAFSSDGKWIAYSSDESGRYEVYVQPFPATGAKWQISKGGGSRAKWRRDGKELFFMTRGGTVMAVELKTGGMFQAGVPQPLFNTDPRVDYAVTGDGQRFLIPASERKAGPAPVTVVINWTAGIKR
jgi:Tol biopolymer transport system component